MIIGIHHVGISVPDMDRAIEFYCGVLGAEHLWSHEVDDKDLNSDRVIGLPDIAASMRMLRLGDSFIELWAYSSPSPTKRDPSYPASDHGLAHFCLQVRDIHAEHHRLSAGGMTFAGPPVDLGTMAAVYGRDPFGNIIEIYEIRDPAVPQLPRALADTLSGGLRR